MKEGKELMKDMADQIKIIQSKIHDSLAEANDFSLLNNLIKIKNKISILVGRNAF